MRVTFKKDWDYLHASRAMTAYKVAQNNEQGFQVVKREVGEAAIKAGAAVAWEGDAEEKPNVEAEKPQDGWTDKVNGE